MKTLLSDTPAGRFLSLIFRLLILDLLFLVSTIPVITTGAAVSALTATSLSLRRGGEEVLRPYFSAFRRNFKQATILFLLMAAAAAFLGFDLYVMAHSSLPGRTYIVSVYVLFVLFVCLVMCWILPLSAQFENTVRGTLKNAVLLCVQHLPASLILLVLSIFPFVFFILFPDAFVSLGFLIFFLYFSAAAYLCAKIFDPVFLSLMTDEERERVLKDSEENDAADDLTS